MRSGSMINTTDTGKSDLIVHTRIEKAEGGGINTNWRVRKLPHHLLLRMVRLPFGDGT